MVFFLHLDVFDEMVSIAPGTRKGSVSFLPVRELRKHSVLLDPVRRPRLDVFDEIRQADRGMKTAQDVQVITSSVDAVKMTLTFLDDSPDVSEQVWATVWMERRRPLLSRKDDVIADRSIG